jgi:hypothetical protein
LFKDLKETVGFKKLLHKNNPSNFNGWQEEQWNGKINYDAKLEKQMKRCK